MDCLCPLVEQIANEWEVEGLEVSQEHFATECIENFYHENGDN